jgi:hypothetical protein
MEHYNVLIATPGSMMEADYVKSLVNTLEECSNRGITYKFLNSYASLVYNARELTMTGYDSRQLDPNDKGPLKDRVSYDKIFWIDSDISWEPWQFFRLYESEHDVITGAYLLADCITTSVHGWGTATHIPKSEIMQMSGETTVQSAGFGFITMKSGVFEKINRPWFKHYTQTLKKEDGSELEMVLGEDISWCIDAYKLGIKIYFDPEVLVKHTKKIPITW